MLGRHNILGLNNTEASKSVSKMIKYQAFAAADKLVINLLMIVINRNAGANKISR